MYKKILGNLFILWSLRIGIGLGIFSLIALFLYYRENIPKPYIPIDSRIIFLLPIGILLWAAFLRIMKRRRERKEKKEAGYLLMEIIIPFYLRMWNNLYKLQNLLFILYPKFFRKLMYLSHRFHHEYLFKWGRNEKKSAIYKILYNLCLGGGVTFLSAFSLVVDLSLLHSLHYTFYSFLITRVYMKVISYMGFLSLCYERIIVK